MSRVSIKIRDRLQELDETVEYVCDDRSLKDDIHPYLKSAVEAAVVYTATYIDNYDDIYESLLNYTLNYLDNIYVNLDASSNIHNEGYDEYEYDVDRIINTISHRDYYEDEEDSLAYQVFDIINDSESEDRIIEIAENICNSIISADLIENEDFLLVSENLGRYFKKLRQVPVEDPDIDEFNYAYHDKLLSVDTKPSTVRRNIARAIRRWD